MRPRRVTTDHEAVQPASPDSPIRLQKELATDFNRLWRVDATCRLHDPCTAQRDSGTARSFLLCGISPTLSTPIVDLDYPNLIIRNHSTQPWAVMWKRIEGLLHASSCLLCERFAASAKDCMAHES